jgi:beta-phosphoglucomutase
LKSPTALIFDMDGVLIDSEPLHRQAKEIAFGEQGIVLPESVYDSYKGQPDRTMLPEILRARGSSAQTIAQVLERKKQIYESLEDKLQPVHGVLEFLRWAAARYKLALATSATARNREASLKLLGVSHLFQAVVDASGHALPKPDPEVFLVAMNKLGAHARECWIIEDSVNGLKAAKAAGCVAIAITTSFDGPTLLGAGADMVVDWFVELQAILEREASP